MTLEDAKFAKKLREYNNELKAKKNRKSVDQVLEELRKTKEEIQNKRKKLELNRRLKEESTQLEKNLKSTTKTKSKEPGLKTNEEKVKIIIDTLTDSALNEKKEQQKQKIKTGGNDKESKSEFFKPYITKAKDSLGFLKQINRNIKELKTKLIDNQDTAIKKKEKEEKPPTQSFLGKFKDDMKEKMTDLPKGIWNKIKRFIGGAFTSMMIGLLGREIFGFLTGGLKTAFKLTKGLGGVLFRFVKFIPTLMRFFFISPIGRALLAGGTVFYSFLKGYFNPNKEQVIDKSASSKAVSGAHNTLMGAAKIADKGANLLGYESTFAKDLDEARKNQNSVDVDKKIQKFFEQTQNGRAVDLENRLKTLNGYKNAKKDWAWYADFFNHILGIPVNDGINLKNKFLGLFREYLRANYWKKDSGESYGKSVYDFNKHEINVELLKSAYLNFITQKNDLSRMFTFMGESERGEILRKLLYDDRFLSIQAGKALITAEQRRKYNLDVNKRLSDIVTEVNNNRIDPVDDGQIKVSQTIQDTTANEVVKSSDGALDTTNVSSTSSTEPKIPKPNAEQIIPYKQETSTNTNQTNIGTSSGFAYPTPHNVITSRFGNRNVGTRYANGGKASKNHKGLDIRARLGEPITALTEGKVTATPKGWGSIYIKQPDGTTAQYMHNSRILVKPGDYIQKGQQIALAGYTGLVGSQNSHLHLGIMDKSGKYIDPEPYLAQHGVHLNIKGGVDSEMKNTTTPQVVASSNQVVEAPQQTNIKESRSQQTQQITNINNFGEQRDRSDYGDTLYPVFSTLDVNNLLV